MNKKNILIPIGICLICLGFILTLITMHFKNEKKLNSNYNKDSIIIRYYPSYNIATAEAINSKKTFIDEVKIELSGKKKEKVSKFLSSIKTFKEDLSSCDDCLYMTDQYEIIANKKKYSMGDEYGVLEDKYFKISEEFNNYMTNIISDYNNKNVYKTINAKKVELKIDNEVLELDDQVDIERILNYKYIIVHEDEDYKIYDGGPKGIITLDNNTKIYLYGKICYISSKELSTYVIFENRDYKDLIETAKELINNNKMNLKEKLKTDNIKIDYKNNTYNITDKDKIEKIYKEIIYFRYSNYNYLRSMTEENLNNEDNIKISINKCRYYIPIDPSYGSRFFVDENGTLYDVGELMNSYFEKTIKEDVNYEE